MNTKHLPAVIFVTVKSPDTTLFEGKAVAITSLNNQGAFDTLPFHTNFISLIKDVLVIHEPGGNDTRIPIQGGIMKFFENTVYIFLGIN